SDADLKSLFDEVNDLPADDPLRAKVDGSAELPVSASQGETDGQNGGEPMSSAAIAATASGGDKGSSSANGAAEAETSAAENSAPPAVQTAPKQNVVVSSGKRVAVPSLIGQPVRSVIERAGSAGLGVQVVGSG